MGYYPTSDAMDWITDDDRGREINGRGGNDRFYGGAGNDVLIGGSGRDTLHGGGGMIDDYYGGSGNDLMFGGQDRLYGEAGNDKLWGGAGTDVFHFGANQGYNVIHDFSIHDWDLIDLNTGSTAAITASETADGNLLLSTNHGTQVELVGVDVDEWKDGWVRWNAEAPGWVW